MLCVKNHACTPSTGRKINTPRYHPRGSHVWPGHILHMSYGHFKTLPNPFPLLFPLPTAHYHKIIGQRWFYTCAPGAMSTLPQAIMHYPNRSGHGWLPAIMKFKQRTGSTLKIPFFCSVYLVLIFYEFSFYTSIRHFLLPFFG